MTAGGAAQAIDVANAPYGMTNQSTMAAYIATGMKAYLPASCSGSETQCAADIAHYLQVATKVLDPCAGQASSSAPTSSSSSSVATANVAACGAGYSAIGNGGWSACYRLAGGTAACHTKDSPTVSKAVTWAGGSPVTNIAHISTSGDNTAIVVTDDGKAYAGSFSNLPTTPVIESGAIAGTGGKNPLCIMTGTASKKDVVCGTANSLSRPALPSGFNVAQVSASYGFVCALNTDGDVWCWNNGGNSGGGLQSVITDTPSKFPFTEPMAFISAGQNSLCGIKRSGGVKCKFSYYDARYLPAKAEANLAETPDDFLPNAVAFQATYGKGVAINKDGSAVYFPGAVTLSGITGAVAAGGHREAIAVINSAGDVYSVNGGTVTQINTSTKVEAASCSL
jgi:hypothetical protein